MSELKPCPFKDQNPDHDRVPFVHDIGGGFRVVCSWCEAKGATHNTAEEAIAARNTRAADEARERTKEEHEKTK